MAKHVEIISGYSVPGRGLIFLSLARDIKPGEIIEVNGKIWKVVSVELSDVAPHAGLVVVPYTEAEAKRTTAKEAKSILEAICNQPDTQPVKVVPVPVVEQNNDDPEVQKVKLTQVLNDLNNQMKNLQEWAVQKLSEFNLGKDPPAVLILTVTMPQTGMESFLQQFEKVLVSAIDELEKSGKLAWANVKAVAGVKS